MIMAEETFKYKSTDVALLMMGRAAENRILMNYTKIQKFLFILYTLYLTSQGHRLTDESPKAWPFGPVFPTVKKKLEKWNVNYCCPLKVSEQRDIHPQCCCNGIADDFSEGKPLS